MPRCHDHIRVRLAEEGDGCGKGPGAAQVEGEVGALDPKVALRCEPDHGSPILLLGARSEALAGRLLRRSWAASGASLGLSSTERRVAKTIWHSRLRVSTTFREQRGVNSLAYPAYARDNPA
eukprot:5484441-Prymnesium_polylepis.4